MLMFCRCSLVIDSEVLNKEHSVREKLKTVKLNSALLEWAPQLTSQSAVEVEESRVEVEVLVQDLHFF